MVTLRLRWVPSDVRRKTQQVFRFTPRVEELEQRLPPGAILDWLLLTNMANTLAPTSPLDTVQSDNRETLPVVGRRHALSWLPARGDQDDVTARHEQSSVVVAAPVTQLAAFETTFAWDTSLPTSLDDLPALVRSLPAALAPEHGSAFAAPTGNAVTDGQDSSMRSPSASPPIPFADDLTLTEMAGRHRNDGGSSGGITSGPGGDQNLVSAGSIWKYLDNGSNQGTAWRGLGFDDLAWASGAAQLGYGDGDEATVVGFGPDPNNKYITTYFRHTFTVADPSTFQTLQTLLLRDDGAAVYLNGNEIYRSNLPAGTINYQTLASAAIGGADESAWHHSALPATVLQAGNNVLAVEVHQSSVNSSDISFDFNLIGATAVRFAVIGDYGINSAAEWYVSELVKSWNVDFVVTAGDNNYPTGSAATIVQNIGAYYCPFIHNPDAPANQRCDAGLSANRFYPTPGNHDWDSTPGLVPYQNYFTLPTGSGNERYYEARWGNVQLFAVDSDPREPSGITSNSTQGNWFQGRLAASTARWKIVAMHHPPYSSGDHGNTPALQWPYQAWGASAVIAGHDHTYERIIRDGFPYFVNGLGGAPRYNFRTPVPGSEARYNENWGAMYVQAGADYLYFAFLDTNYTYFDEYYVF